MGDDLLASIKNAKKYNLATRCVTNGFWAKTTSIANRMASKLVECGLDELNVSTGSDHAEWVPIDVALNAAKAAATHGIFTVVTIEQDRADSGVIEQVRKDVELASLEKAGLLTTQVNSWMPFHKGSAERTAIGNRESMLCQGCDQVVENCVLTPHREISGCCGLTFEHIPEMKINWVSGDSLREKYISQAQDFLKIWLKVDGPYQIVKNLAWDEYKDDLEKIVHPCQACALLHQSGLLRERMVEQHGSHMGRVLRQFFSQASITVNI
ncbi:hypothetical protein D3C76_943590 [compost metagenome]